MSMEIFPRHFLAWKECITKKCNINLTIEFIQKRIDALSDKASSEHQRFVEMYGEHWTHTILNYLKQALDEKNVN